MTTTEAPTAVVSAYLELGLALGRHIDGFVDAYYGPAELAARIADEPRRSPRHLVSQARELISAIDGGADLDDVYETGHDSQGGATDAARRHWIRAQTIGLLTTARRLSGEEISYADEVESCYGVRPHPIEWDEVALAHQRLEEVVPARGLSQNDSRPGASPTQSNPRS